MTKTITNSAYPLSWPVNQPRTPPFKRERSKFKMESFARHRDELLREVRLLKVKQIVLSTNVPLRQDGLPLANARRPEDPGVAVYFIDRQNRQMALACDRWQTVEENMRALESTISALRGIERWGSSSMVDAAFTGFQALPAKKRWFELLGVSVHTANDVVTDLFRRKLMETHPDRGGTTEAFQELEAAQREFRLERGL